MAAGSLSDSVHGRNATSPHQIPPPGWKDVLWRTYKEIGADRVTLIAAAVTYYLLLALFPTLTAFVSIYGLFTEPATVTEHVRLLSSVVPAGGMAIIDEQLTRLTSAGGSTLGIALLISLAIALWSASSGVKTLFEAMNIAYDEEEKRNFVVLNATALAFTFASIVGAVVMIALSVATPVALDFVGLSTRLEWLIRIGSYLVLGLAFMIGLSALYRFGPSRQQAKWRWVSPGAILATTIILVVSMLFGWYATNFGNFDRTYGSLGGLIALLTWIWISVNAVIVGAELNSEAERQTRKDSTIGADAPIGYRDAVAADTVGPTADEASRPGREVAEKSAEWVAGYNAAMSTMHRKGPAPLGLLLAATPVFFVLQAMRRRRQN